MYKWVSFPYSCTESTLEVKGKYLYAVGGFHSQDNGCPSWGSNDPGRIRFIGDVIGNISLSYIGGAHDVIPLIFGYTMWYHSIWSEHPSPFFPDDASNEMSALLKSVLSIKGAYEGEEYGVLRIALRDEPVTDIHVESAPDKEGMPVYVGGYIALEERGIMSGGAKDIAPDDDFYSSHTICYDDVCPSVNKDALLRICHALHTFEEDFNNFCEGDRHSMRLGGDHFAEIASQVIHSNMDNLVERVDGDGFIHTSYQGAPSWRYDGFGPYVLNANSYWDAFYSRDGARAIMTLNSFGHTQKADSACRCAYRWMMYYKDNHLRIRDTEIPGHFSVIINKPMIYSTYLAPFANWPTKYSKELFGEGYQNLGNQETDGHGLMMLADYCVWKNTGSSVAWINDNWTYIQEAVDWIIWCFTYPELSFAKDGLLYGETEAAMNDWTMYANLPCYLGLMGYIEMCRAIGKNDLADKWDIYAKTLKAGIDNRLVKDNGWDLKHIGFMHDPVPTMLSDFYGYDTEDMPKKWIERSRVTYKDDIKNASEHGYYGAAGLGYDHSMITQNALLLDCMYDASMLMTSLSKICYSPRLPEPFIVPEGVSVDPIKGVLRRQGDLGNLVQLAEAMKCYLILFGISPLNGDTIKVMPRLPISWEAEVEDFAIQNSGCRIDLSVSRSENGSRAITYSLRKSKEDHVSHIKLRFGPFPLEQSSVDISLNGKTYNKPLFVSGDSKWCWVDEEI